MTEHYIFEKNRIQFPAKIRTNEYEIEKERYNRDGSARKVIRLTNSESLRVLDQSCNYPTT